MGRSAMTRDDMIRSFAHCLDRFAAEVAAAERDQAEAEWRYLMVEVRKVGEQALEALENPLGAGPEGVANAITALRATLNGRAFVRGET